MEGKRHPEVLRWGMNCLFHSMFSLFSHLFGFSGRGCSFPLTGDGPGHQSHCYVWGSFVAFWSTLHLSPPLILIGSSYVLVFVALRTFRSGGVLGFVIFLFSYCLYVQVASLLMYMRVGPDHIWPASGGALATTARSFHYWEWHIVTEGTTTKDECHRKVIDLGFHCKNHLIRVCMSRILLSLSTHLITRI